MAKIISHRALVKGSDLERENNPKYVLELLFQNIPVEIDVRFINGWYYLGHDYPSYRIEHEPFLESPLLYCHAKDLTSLNKMLDNPNIHCFYQSSDAYSITSKGLIWTNVDMPVCEKSIIVDLRPNPDYDLNCEGICVDYIK